MVDEYLIDALAKHRLEEMRSWAERQAIVRSLPPTRGSLRTVVGTGLIRAGRWLLGEIPELPAERHRTA